MKEKKIQEKKCNSSLDSYSRRDVLGSIFHTEKKVSQKL